MRILLFFIRLDQKKITFGLLNNMFFVSHGMRMGVILVIKTGLSLHYITLHYIMLHYMYISYTFH